jgi:tetratricopeptide (TPR) repeat protein
MFPNISQRIAKISRDGIAFVDKKKDFLGVLFGFAAFIISIYTLIQGIYEEERTLRSHITDVMGKLAPVSREIEKIRKESVDPEEPYTKSQIDKLERQYNSLVYQADYIAKQIPHLISEVEYSNIAIAFAEINDYYKAESYWQRAIETSLRGYKKDEMWYANLRKAYNIRRFADFLYDYSYYDRAYEQYNRSLDLLVTEHDQVLWDRAWTYIQQARLAAATSKKSIAERYLILSYQTYSRIKLKHLKERGW